MKHLEFTNRFFTKQRITFANQIAIITGHNCSGKTTILNTLAKGFQGNKKNFFVDHQPVKPGDYQVAYLTDHSELKTEIKLTKTNHFRHYLLQKMNRLLLNEANYQQVTNQVHELANKIEQIINQALDKQITSFTNQEIALQFDTQKINLESIIDHLLQIKLIRQADQIVLDEKHFNEFLLRMVVFSVLKTSLDWYDTQRPIVILIDNPGLFANYQTLTEFALALKKLLQNQHVHLCIATTNADFIQQIGCLPTALNFLQNQQITHLPDVNTILERGISLYGFLTNNEYQDWRWYQNDFKHVCDLKDLQNELEHFWNRQIVNLIKAYFARRIVLANNDEIVKLGVDNGFQLVLHENWKNTLLLFVFYQKLNLPVEITSLLKQKWTKLTFLWK